MASKLKVALCQMLVTKVKQENIAKATQMINTAKSNGASMVVLPECFNCPYGTKYFKEYSECIGFDFADAGKSTTVADLEADGKSPTVVAMRNLAKENNIWLVAGSIPEVDNGDGKIYNSSMIIGPDGEIKNVHRKVHLFKINTETVKFDESEVLTGGKTTKAVDMKDGLSLGVGICFDVRYPQLALSYRQQGTNMLVYPGAFNMVTGPKHWTLCAQSRALDAQQYCMMCSPARDTTAEYVAYGHSIVVDPFGEVVGELDENEGILYADLDVLPTVDATRQRLPITAGTRDDIYNFTWNQ